MTIQFAALEGEYTRLLATMEITRPAAVDMTAKRLLSYVDQLRYAPVSEKTGVPQIVMAASFEREASSNFRLSPAQGDPWNEVSRNVPRGVGPFPSWAAAAIWSYHHDGLDRVGAANWSWERACFEEELFNGFGYRSRGVHSPYLWSGSSVYDDAKPIGKYTGDGHFEYGVKDSQLGVIPMMFRMVQLRPSLTLPFAFPVQTSALTQPVTPQAAPHGLHDAAALQAALNKLGADPQLVVDNSYGRMTRQAVSAFQKAHGLDVDGIAGDDTWTAINHELEGK